MPNSQIWQHLQNADFGLMSTLAQQLQRLELLGEINLPQLSSDRVYIASDYGGEHKESRFHTFSILLCDMERLEPWFIEKGRIRADRMKDGRRMAYKSLGDGVRRAVLLPFLRSADLITGVCATFAIHKDVGELFPNAEMFGKDESTAIAGIWNTATFEKLMRVTNLSSLLLSLLSHEDQDIVWVSDEDEIAANACRYNLLCKIFSSVCNHYLIHNLGHLRAGTTVHDTSNDRNMEDLVSIPDLVAGAVADAVTCMHDQGRLGSPIVSKLSDEVWPKCKYILQWMANKPKNLQKWVCYICPTVPGYVRCGWWRMINDSGSSLILPDSFHIAALKGSVCKLSIKPCND